MRAETSLKEKGAKERGVGSLLQLLATVGTVDDSKGEEEKNEKATWAPAEMK